MSSTNKTQNVELSQFLGQDKPAWLTDYNEDMRKIDAAFDTRDKSSEASMKQIEQLEADVQNLETANTATNEALKETSDNFTQTSKTLQDTVDELVKQVAQNAVAIQNLQEQVNRLE